MFKELEIREEAKRAEVTHNLHLCYMTLSTYPTGILKGNLLASLESSLVRLDLSYNNLTLFPREITNLVNLKELWLHNNPLAGTILFVTTKKI
jgi:Leucine-rich repeat (LRR) protein